MRKAGAPTSADKAAAFDVILGVQVRIAIERDGIAVVIATTNVGHLARFSDARAW